MRWRAALAGGTELGDDAPLGGADEAQDGIPFRRLREVLLDVGHRVADVHSLEIDGFVDVLDLVDLVFGESAAGQAHAVHALEADGFAAGQHVGRDVLGDLESGPDHGMGADAAELMGDGRTAHDGPVVDVRFPREGGVAHEDAVVADGAVVRDVDIGHDERVAAYLRDRLPAGLGAAVDRGALADGHPVSDLHPGLFSFEFQVLRYGAHNGAGKHGAVLAHLHVGEDGGMREDLAAVSDLDVFIDEHIGPDLDAVTEDGGGMDRCKGMDGIHGQWFT